MNREKFTLEKKRIFFFIVVYGLLCEAFSLFILGTDRGFITGVILGVIVVTVNFVTLEKVIDNVLRTKRIMLAFPLHLGRFLLYGLGAYFVYAVGRSGLIAYGIGVIGLPLSVFCAILIEGRQENFDQF